MPTRRIFYRRKFLNRPRQLGGSHVIASIELRTDRRGRPGIDALLNLSDCYRTIELDFHTWSPADARNALHKAVLLRDVLADYVEALERAIGDWEELREQQPEPKQDKSTRQD